MYCFTTLGAAELRRFKRLCTQNVTIRFRVSRSIAECVPVLHNHQRSWILDCQRAGSVFLFETLFLDQPPVFSSRPNLEILGLDLLHQTHHTSFLQHILYVSAEKQVHHHTVRGRFWIAHLSRLSKTRLCSAESQHALCPTGTSAFEKSA